MTHGGGGVNTIQNAISSRMGYKIATVFGALSFLVPGFALAQTIHPPFVDAFVCTRNGDLDSGSHTSTLWTLVDWDDTTGNLQYLTQDQGNSSYISFAQDDGRMTYFFSDPTYWDCADGYNSGDPSETSFNVLHPDDTGNHAAMARMYGISTTTLTGTVVETTTTNLSTDPILDVLIAGLLMLVSAMYVRRVFFS